MKRQHFIALFLVLCFFLFLVPSTVIAGEKEGVTEDKKEESVKTEDKTDEKKESPVKSDKKDAPKPEDPPIFQNNEESDS